MAASRRHRPAPLIDDLFARPREFGFFQAVRILELAGGTDDGARPVGEDQSPERECVRFRSSPRLTFPASDLHRLHRDEGSGSQPELHVDFLGFVGPAGILPQHYSELVNERLQQRDTTLRDWLDVFQHRLVSLFYRAGTKYRFPYAYERRVRRAADDDAFTTAVLSLIGLGQDALRGHSPSGDAVLAFQAGHLSRRARPAEGLARLLNDVFAVPTRIEEFVGRWLPVAHEERCRLSVRPGGRDQVRLGGGAVLGQRVWDVRSKVRIHLGPLSYDEFQYLCRPAPGHARLASLSRGYLGLGLDFDFRFELRPGESPGIRLGGGDDGRRARLGFDTWLEARPRPHAPRFATARTGQGPGRPG